MQPIAEHRKFDSIEAYLDFEERSDVRHEYYFENLIEMFGTTKRHSQIVFALMLFFKQTLSNENYEIFSEQIKAYIKTEKFFFYPDVMIAFPEESQFYNSQPILITEVLSESTRKFDMIDKFVQYQKMDTLQYYLLVEPDKHLVIIHKKTDDNSWQTETFTSISDVIDLPKLNLSLALKDIYRA